MSALLASGWHIFGLKHVIFKRSLGPIKHEMSRRRGLDGVGVCTHLLSFDIHLVLRFLCDVYGRVFLLLLQIPRAYRAGFKLN